MPDRYSYPEEGSSDWHVPINNNFSMLDEHVEHREARAPDFNEETPLEGAKFLNTNTGEIYIADGSSWGNPVWNLGDIGSGGSDSGIHQFRADGYIVCVKNSGDIAVDVIDPSTTSTPIQDAYETAYEGNFSGGEIYLPYETVQSPGDIAVHPGVSLYGDLRTSEIEITNFNADGLVFDNGQFGDPDEYIWYANIDGVQLTGPGHGGNTGYAIHDKGRWRSHVGSLQLNNWNGVVWRDTYQSFGCHHDFVTFNDCDAGSAEALMVVENHAEPLSFNHISAFCDSDHSGTVSDVIYSDVGANLMINVLRGARNPGRLFVSGSGQNNVYIGHAHWEPHTPATIPNEIFWLNGGGIHIKSVYLQGHDVNTDEISIPYVYRTYALGVSYLAVPSVAGEASVTENMVDAYGYGIPDRPTLFAGHYGQIDFNDTATDSPRDGFIALAQDHRVTNDATEEPQNDGDIMYYI